MNEQASRYKVPASALTVHLIDDRRTQVSPWSRGNSKVGPGIYTYSKLPESTCPGASVECLAICYAKRAANQNEWVHRLWQSNTILGDEVPPLPEDARIVRFHVSGDFDTVGYVESWIALANARPEVKFFGYTRSWRVGHLLPALERFRALSNVFLWASMDKTVSELPPDGWRRAWIEDDERLISDDKRGDRYRVNELLAVVCPEAAGRKKDCESCTFCFIPHKIDLVFPRH